MLRRLKKEDAPLMLEWMHNRVNNDIFQTNFTSMKKEDVENFIEHSYSQTNQHFAIVEENDEYLGTISLKNIDQKNKNAEYAISIRDIAKGKGIAALATEQILKYAFNELQLDRIYLCVLNINKRANRFYEKFGFVYEGKFRNHLHNDLGYHDLLWYGLLKDEYNE
ncbi:MULTISPECIES: GNAT family protein [unclassified Breznakia]|uniref:GNAT family N-acetyltransferase n=1 Tax=unclassified Breznakia TaxID=2623764 RepID=UPI00240613D9|nr:MULTISPECIES: GNAT family protein [unclassified Breznakia]